MQELARFPARSNGCERSADRPRPIVSTRDAARPRGMASFVRACVRRPWAPIAALVLFACGPDGGATNTSDSEVIIGNDDRIVVDADGSNVPMRFRGILDAVGLLDVPGTETGCTLTHVGNGLAITAGHCVVTSACEGSRIRWGFRDGA